MSKEEPDFNVNTDKLNSISDVAEKDFTSSFAESLVEASKVVHIVSLRQND